MKYFLIHPAQKRTILKLQNSRKETIRTILDDSGIFVMFHKSQLSQYTLNITVIRKVTVFQMQHDT